jgi:cobalamin biosynthesis protein CbiG
MAMDAVIITFTKKGYELGRFIRDSLEGYESRLVFRDAVIREVCRTAFEKAVPLIFIGAAGIAVRSVAPFVKDKLSDPPVIVIDELGRFVIPILSGHMGGANELAAELSECMAASYSAVPVITTATDINGTFSVDLFAKENGLTVVGFNNTLVESALAKAAFGKDANYTISTTEHGPLAPNGVDPIPFYERMTKGAVYENVEVAENEVPDGEYVVLTFPDEQVRYDFFFAEGSGNLIRTVQGPEGEDQYTFFTKVTFEDGTSKASEIMHEWYNAIVEANGIK